VESSNLPLNEHSLIAVLGNHIGKLNGITVSGLVRQIAGVTDAGLERECRRLIMELRMKGHHICGRPETGYFIAATADELRETCEWLYSRAMTSLRQISAMQRVSLPDLRGQLNLLAGEE